MKTIFLSVLMILSLIIKAQDTPEMSESKNNNISYYVGAGGQLFILYNSNPLAPNVFGGLAYKRHKFQIGYTHIKETRNFLYNPNIFSTGPKYNSTEIYNINVFEFNYLYRFWPKNKLGLEMGLGYYYFDDNTSQKSYDDSGSIVYQFSDNEKFGVIVLTNRINYQAWKKINFGVQMDLYMDVLAAGVNFGANVRYEF